MDQEGRSHGLDHLLTGLEVVEWFYKVVEVRIVDWYVGIILRTRHGYELGGSWVGLMKASLQSICILQMIFRCGGSGNATKLDMCIKIS